MEAGTLPKNGDVCKKTRTQYLKNLLSYRHFKFEKNIFKIFDLLLPKKNISGNGPIGTKS